jgi:hypothetical protein
MSSPIINAGMFPRDTFKAIDNNYKPSIKFCPILQCFYEIVVSPIGHIDYHIPTNDYAAASDHKINALNSINLSVTNISA